MSLFEIASLAFVACKRQCTLIAAPSFVRTAQSAKKVGASGVEKVMVFKCAVLSDRIE